MIAAREGDGRFGPSQWVPNSTAGHWQPVLPNGTTALDPTPWVGGVDPFLLQSSSQFRTAGPNALTSAAYAAEFNEVKALGGDGVTTPTTAPRRRRTTRVLAERRRPGAPVERRRTRTSSTIRPRGRCSPTAARLFAMMNLSAADAAINCWNDKYHFDFWRPWQAIRRGRTARATLTRCRCRTGRRCSQRHIPTTRPGTCASTARISTRCSCSSGPTTCITPSPAASSVGRRASSSGSRSRSNEIIDARVWAGLHFRTADVQGRELGINVANYMVDNYFQPVGNH